MPTLTSLDEVFITKYLVITDILASREPKQVMQELKKKS